MLPFLRRPFPDDFCDALHRFAAERGFRHVPPSGWRSPQAIAASRHFLLTVDAYVMRGAQRSLVRDFWTRVRVPYRALDDFELTVGPRTAVASWMGGLGAPPVATGDPAFDAACVLRSHQPERAWWVLSNRALVTALLGGAPGYLLTTRKTPRLADAPLPAGYRQILFQVRGLSTDADALQRLVVIAHESLRSLVYFGVAADEPVHVGPA